jgi:putative membrane protein
MADAVVAYLHYLGMMLLLGALVGEHLILSGKLDLQRARQLAATDVIYVSAAALVLVTGLLRASYFGKGLPFYTGNPLFHAKVSLFVLAALISVYPTVQFFSMRAGIRTEQMPELAPALIDRLKILIRIELTLIVCIPMLAVLMGRGFGY